MISHKLGGTAPGAATLLNWCDAKSVPQSRLLDPVSDFLFDGKPDDDPGRVRIKDLWQAAENEKNQSSTTLRRTGTRRGPPGGSGLDDADPAASDWIAEDTEPLQRGLAELFVHPPPRGGNTPNSFPLRISLSFAECPDTVGDDRDGTLQDLTLALTDAILEPDYKGCRPAPGSAVGSEKNPHPNLEFKAGTWRVKGPRPHNIHLDGEPLSEDPLCTINTDGGLDDSLTLTLRSRYRALVVVPDEPGADASTLKHKVLQALLQKFPKRNQAGFVTWGKASLKRKPRDETKQ